MNENPLRPEVWLPQALSLSAAVVVYVVLTLIGYRKEKGGKR